LPTWGSPVRARSRAPDKDQPRQVFSLAGLMRLGLPHMGSFKRKSLVSLAAVRLEGRSLISSQDSGDSISGASVVVTGFWVFRGVTSRLEHSQGAMGGLCQARAHEPSSCQENVGRQRLVIVRYRHYQASLPFATVAAHARNTHKPAALARSDPNPPATAQAWRTTC